MPISYDMGGVFMRKASLSAVRWWLIVKAASGSEVKSDTSRSSARAAAFMSLAVLALAQLGVSAENGAFSVAMSEMMRVFSCSVSDVQLASTVYSLMAGTFMLASGLLGIMIGWRRLFVAGVILITGGEVVAAVAPTIDVLIWGGRMLVGVGASLVIPSVLGMVPLLFEGAQRKQAYGVIAGSAALATIVPIPLGMLIDNFGFRVTFGILAGYFLILAVASRALPPSCPHESKTFDIPGIILASLGLFAVMFGLSRVSAWGVTEPLPTAPFTIAGLSPALFIAGAGLVLLVVLVPVEAWMEQRRGVALLPSCFVRNAQVRSGLVAIALPFFYMGAQGLVATSFYQLVAGFDGTKTALLGIISGVPMLLLATFLPRKFPHLNPWAVVRCGYISIAASALLTAFGVRESSLSLVILAGTLLGGIGVGLVNSQANNLVASAVPARAAQQSGGIQGAARNLGLALGAAAMGSVLLIAVNTGLDARVNSLTTLPESVQSALEDVVYTYESDAMFARRLEALGVDDADAEQLMEDNREVRANAGAMAMGTVAAVSALALFTTFPRRKQEELQPTH